MPCGQADIRDSYVRGRRVMRLRKRRVAAHRPMALLESAHTSGTTFEVPAANGLMLSQSVGRPFRYICDIGAGRFSGHTQPGDSGSMIRLSVGLEDAQDLIADLEQALEGCGG